MRSASGPLTVPAPGSSTSSPVPPCSTSLAALARLPRDAARLAAADPVVARPAVERVVAVSAAERVDAVAALHDVAAGAAEERVVAGAAVDRVVPGSALQAVAPDAARELVDRAALARAAGSFGVQLVVAGAAVERVRAGAAVEPIRVGGAAQDVVARVAAQQRPDRRGHRRLVVQVREIDGDLVDARGRAADAPRVTGHGRAPGEDLEPCDARVRDEQVGLCDRDRQPVGLSGRRDEVRAGRPLD